MYKKLIKYSNRLKFFILLVYVIKRSLILDFELLISNKGHATFLNFIMKGGLIYY